MPTSEPSIDSATAWSTKNEPEPGAATVGYQEGMNRTCITNLYLALSVCANATWSAVTTPSAEPWRVCPIGKLSTLGTTASTFKGSSGSSCLLTKQGCWCSGSG